MNFLLWFGNLLLFGWVWIGGRFSDWLFFGGLRGWFNFGGLRSRLRGFFLGVFGTFGEGKAEGKGFPCELSDCSIEHGPN